MCWAGWAVVWKSMGKKLRIKLFIGICLVIATEFGCSGKEEKCPPIVDTVNIIDQANYKNKPYFLVLRITGFQDKTEILQLYVNKPQFNLCNKSMNKPLIEDSLENYAIKDFSVDLTHNKFLIDYDNSQEGTGRRLLRLKFK